MQVMSEPGFSSADETEYQQHAHRLIDASLAAVSATREKKHPEFQSALSAIEKACNDCHQDYRFNSE
jgi:cytochrome c556